MLARLRDLTDKEKLALFTTLPACAVIGTSALVAGLKFGIIQKFLPWNLAKKLDETLEKIAAATEPQRTSMNSLRTRVDFLSGVYAKASLGFLIGGIGTLAFVRNPYIPVMPAAAACFVGFGASIFLGDKLTPGPRRALFAATCFTGGIALGPMNWIARENNSVLFATAMSTTVAFAVAPMITRGWISNFFVSQALSASLAVVAVKTIVLTTFPKAKRDFSTDPSLATSALEILAAPIYLNNLLLTQMVGNGILVAFHTAPILNHSRSVEGFYNGDTEPDELNDALMINGSVCYAVFRLFQFCCQQIGKFIKRNAAGTAKVASTGKVEITVNLGGGKDGGSRGRPMIFDPVADGLSAAAFFWLYLKFVHRLQRSDDIESSFRLLSKIFSALSPVKMARRN